MGSKFEGFLQSVIRRRADGRAWGWMESALAACRPPVDSEAFLAYYTGASRRLGKKALALGEGERAELGELDPALILDHWGLDEAGRALLLLQPARLPNEEYESLILDCYLQGDNREQQSWLRALALLPRPESFLETAIDACRTNILPLLESIACENPYPSRYFPELNFNQMVLKGLFNGVEVARIVGLAGRFNPDLSRMANDYVTERELAHREVPPDIWLVLIPEADSGMLKRAVRYLEHENPQHRYWNALGFGYRRDGAGREALNRRLELERDENVLDALHRAVQKQVEDPHKE